MAAPRPYAHVERTLRGLAGQAEGFGRQAIGGLHGDVYHVTTLDGTFYLFIFVSLYSINKYFTKEVK